MGDIEITYRGRIVLGTPLAAYVYEIMELCDNDFVPPLSRRNSTAKPLSNQDDKIEADSIDPYFEILLAQKNIVAFSENKAVAFMSFIHAFDKYYYFPTKATENDKINYITTICVHPDFRWNGIAQRFYDFIERELPKEVCGASLRRGHGMQTAVIEAV